MSKRQNGPSSSSAKGGHLVIDNQKLRVNGLFHFDRAVGYRTLHSEEFKLVDEELLAALGQTLTQFGDVIHNQQQQLRLEDDVRWTSLMEAFTQGSFFQPDGRQTEVIDSFVTHNTHLSRHALNFWKSPTEILRRHLKKTKRTPRKAVDWFEQTLVKDRIIRESVRLDVKHVYQEQEKIIQKLIEREDLQEAQHQHLHDDASDATLFPEHEETHTGDTNTFLDIGVLRFPDFQEPYVQVYRIQLTAWTEVNLDELEIKSGIKGVYNSCQFRPRSAFLKTFEQKALDIAKARAVDYLFQGQDSESERTPSLLSSNASTEETLT